MSKDLKPCEMLELAKALHMASMFDLKWIIHRDGYEDVPMHTEEQIAYSHKFPTLAICGPTIVERMQRYEGEADELLLMVEDIINNKPVDDAELVNMTTRWFRGELQPGYYMDENTGEFLHYLKNRIKKNRE